MNQELLKHILSNNFSFDAWKNLLCKIFPNVDYFSQEVPIDASLIKSGGQVGIIRLDDGRSLAIFKFEVADNIVIARNRRGLRDIAAKYVDQSLIHGALVLYYSSAQEDYRLTYVAKQTSFNSDGQLIKDETAPKRYTFLLGPNETCTTAANRLHELAENKRKNGSMYLADVTEAFSVERLNKEFFDGYKKQYSKFLATLSDTKQNRDYVKKLLGRIVFLHFLQKKGWMGVPASRSDWSDGDKNYLANLVDRYKGNERLLSDVLELLFFKTLNEPRPGDLADPILGDNIKIPYLNGGLFDKDNIDWLDIDFPYDYFKNLMDFFSQYNFTIDENDPNDAEVGVDPEMLGKIFENLLEDNKDKGAFYTPKEIVRYMCQESLIAYLESNTSIAKDKIRQFVLSPEDGVIDISDNKKSKLLAALEEVKICDPAIGSGAFPMGLLNELLHCREVLSGGHYDRAEIKKSIIQNNIYGVDIEKGAVDIARLRFWLSIVVDEEKPSPLPNLDYKIMQGNSLIESFMGVDLSKLTYEKEHKKDKGEISLFDDEKNRLQKTVSHLLSSYYSCSGHDKKVKLQQEISDTISKQLEAQAYDPAILCELKNLNLAENNKFFLWHTWFSDVFNRDGKNGFDIVIGNPPYIDSETMTLLGQTDLREYIVKHYKYTKGNWDIYMAFLEWGLAISEGCLCFITPDKWLSKPFGSKFREHCMIPRMKIILHTGNKTFESAMVDAIITLFVRESSTISAYKFDKNKSIVHVNTEPSLSILKPYYIDSLFSENNYLIRKIEKSSIVLHSIAECENACATSDAYKLSPYVHNLDSEYSSAKEYKLVNTGTIDKFSNRWGVKDITYLGVKYINPVVDKTDFTCNFGKAYVRKALSKKLIFKGLNLLDGFIDINGDYLPGKSTLVICSDNIGDLKFLCGLLNAKLTIFYIKSKYASSSYCGGITFSKDMINSFPILSNLDFKNKIISIVDDILKLGYSNDLNRLLNATVYSAYNLSPKEINIIEQSI